MAGFIVSFFLFLYIYIYSPSSTEPPTQGQCNPEAQHPSLQQIVILTVRQRKRENEFTPFPFHPLLLLHLMAFVWFLPWISVTVYRFCPHIIPYFQNCPHVFPGVGGRRASIKALCALDSQRKASDPRRWLRSRESLPEDEWGQYLENQSWEMESPVDIVFKTSGLCSGNADAQWAFSCIFLEITRHLTNLWEHQVLEFWNVAWAVSSYSTYPAHSFNE